MAASHPAARHSPGNTTGAWAALYQRQDPRQVLAAAAAALGKEEEEEEESAVQPARASADYNINSSPMNDRITYEDTVNFSDISHSNEEYFRRLKELKAAHIKTMKILRRMYQEKLNLKEVQPVIIKEDSPSISSSCATGKNSYHPVLLVTSLSEPDLTRSSSLHTSSSEEDLPQLKKELSKKHKMMTYAKELINNMWRDFCVEDYIKCDDSDFPAVEKTKKKPKEWVPKVTVPVPFQMTIREQKKKEEAKKAMSDIEMMRKLIKTQADSERRKKFRANPLPSYIFFPRYQDMVKQNEERRRMMKEKNKEALLALQKPFKFIAREEQKRAAREKQLRDLLKSKKKTSRFKARPIPRSTYGFSSPISDKLKEEELYRSLRAQLKAQEFLEAFSALPSGTTCRNPRNPERSGKLRSKARGRGQVPDTHDPPLKYKEFSELRFPTRSTVYKQFDLQTSSSDSAKRDKVRADIRADEENLRETRWPYLSPRCNSSVKNANPKPPLYKTVSPTKHTVSSRGREQATRRSLEEKKMSEEERNRILTKQKQRMKELQKLLTIRVKAYDLHQSLAQMSKSKLKHLRKSEKERMKEYRQELEEREEELKQRPLLFERVAQKNARMAAEKHYSNTLKALGLSDEFVSKKGQSGKLLEYLSNQDMKSCLEDKESFNEEEKIEERESEEENYFVETTIQDSYQGKDEDGEGSREENTED
ncbi:protein FAM161A-like isoform X1 [Dipodomys merriami]|uniref:protein FAM161A-like isoform X1 n=1 Tax=Dipodomys merriami TaxID=94247 RepID=UPI003855778C